MDCSPQKAVDYQDFLESSSFSPYAEMIAYEILWAERGASIKSLSQILSTQNKLPSEVVKEKYGFFDPALKKEVEEHIRTRLGKFSVMLKENFQHPRTLLDATHPVDLFYYRGNLDWLDSKCVSVVGTRQSTDEGRRRTARLTKLLAKNEFTIVSGLAEGVDTVAMSTALEMGSRVIGVIGTPIDEYYPKKNHKLQDLIAEKHLLISQVPFYRYSTQPFLSKRAYFPQRNVTMAAISEATVIVEASDTSGTLTQARACIAQGRKLFILNSCFENPDISWPEKYREKGAIRVRDIDDIVNHLA